MKVLNFMVGSDRHLGIYTDEGIIDVTAAAQTVEGLPASMDALFSSGAAGLEKLAELSKKADRFLPEAEIQYAPCVANPEKILCVGLNYISHSKEVEMKIPDYPVLFSKFNNALTGHNHPINLPASAYMFDYEAELVIVIGKTGKNIFPEEALDYVFGYTLGNDVSARDLQLRTGQWLLGKTCDGFAPVGPCITVGESINSDALEIECRVNDEIKQHSNTSKMMFNCAEIISYASQFMTLKPGDLIFSGTPEGVVMGYPEGERNWLKAGDSVSVTIEKLGTLTNHFI